MLVLDRCSEGGEMIVEWKEAMTFEDRLDWLKKTVFTSTAYVPLTAATNST